MWNSKKELMTSTTLGLWPSAARVTGATPGAGMVRGPERRVSLLQPPFYQVLRVLTLVFQGNFRQVTDINRLFFQSALVLEKWASGK